MARVVAGAIIALLLGACSSVEVPEDRFFRLSVTPQAAPSVSPVLTTLVVERFEVEGITAQRPIVHSERGAPFELRQHVYAFWADSPSRLFQDVTIDAVRAAGIAERVVTPALRQSAEFRLAGRVRQLEHVRGEPSAARVAVEFSLSRASDGEVLLLDRSSREVTVEERGVGPVVLAMNGALDDIYGHLVERLAGLEGKLAEAVSRRP
ncbi:MAG: ABC-type transport auxiliary lipoprotein family protein [Gammaproteobacteria bacterium]